MIARVGRFQVSVDKMAETIKVFKEGVVPAVKLQKVYRSGYLLADHKTGKCRQLLVKNSIGLKG